MYALEATEFAQQNGKFLEFHHAAYEAYWTDRKDLGDLEVIDRHDHEWLWRAALRIRQIAELRIIVTLNNARDLRDRIQARSDR